MNDATKPQTPAPAGTFKPAAAPAPTQPAPTRVEIVSAPGAAIPPNASAPDGSDPSKYPANGTMLDGSMARAGTPLGGDTVKAEVASGQPPAYDAENKHDIVEEPSESAGRLPVHMKLVDFAIGKNCYKLGVSHPPYVVEATDGKTYAVLRAGTGGTIHIANDSEASYFTLDQKRQYAVADGNPNVSGDVKHP